MPENPISKDQMRRIFQKARRRIQPGEESFGEEDIIRGSIPEPQKGPEGLATPDERLQLQNKIRETSEYVLAHGVIPSTEGESLSFKERFAHIHRRELVDETSTYILSAGRKLWWGDNPLLSLEVNKEDRAAAIIIGFDGKIQIFDDHISFENGEQKKTYDHANTTLSTLSLKDFRRINQFVDEARIVLLPHE